MRYAHPGQPGAVVSFKSAYGNFIDGRFVEPLSGEFFMKYFAGRRQQHCAVSPLGCQRH